MHRKRVLYPFLALLVTTLAFALVFFSGFLSSTVCVRLLQGPTASFYSLPFWLRYCLLHPLMLKILARVGFGVSLLGSMLTLFLLLRTEPSPAASKFLAGIGRSVLFCVGGMMGLLLPLAGVIEYQVHFTHNHFGSWSSVKVFLIALLVDMVPGTIAFTAFIFVFLVIISSLVKIIGRLQISAPAWQSPHVLQ